MYKHKVHAQHSLLFTQGTKDGNQFTLTICRFLVLYSFHQEEHLAKAGVITQYISGIIFFGRATILNALVKYRETKKVGFFEQIFQTNYSSIKLNFLPLRKTLPHFKEYLHLQSDFPLSTLYYTWNWLKKLSQTPKHATNPNLINDFQTIIIGKSTVNLGDIGAIFHKLLDSI
ncbi:hypothetical protein BJ322DRAFT_1025416 [Thelephora terrestris]|uniref:Uncharacterized protein n=1 Tax=Thelephora terrestris TaxID=56493 RepID=A0A9P6L0L0_9AGAM|nr:hypothetical protein BJ322DRAFT_1025416 [Thelephora terrestris]